MGYQNQITLVGNITRDPELAYTNASKAYLRFDIAYTPRVLNSQTGQWEDSDPNFYSCTLWGRDAEAAAQSLQKGQRVIVIGDLIQESWEKDGEKRSKLTIRAIEVGLSAKFSRLSAVKLNNANTQQQGGRAQPQAGGFQPQQQDPWGGQQQPQNTGFQQAQQAYQQPGGFQPQQPQQQQPSQQGQPQGQQGNMPDNPWASNNDNPPF